jgi:hypothetical protein
MEKFGDISYEGGDITTLNEGRFASVPALQVQFLPIKS